MDLSSTQRACLAALVDTFFPSLPRAEDPTGFWARTGSDLGLPSALEHFIVASLPGEAARAACSVLDLLAAARFPDLPTAEREEVRRRLPEDDPTAMQILGTLQAVSLLLAYALPGADGFNLNWSQLNYPGPFGSPPMVAKPIHPLVPTGDRITLEADVVVVGSGAGGSVVACELARQGRRVIVLEAGGYFNEADFPQLELWGQQNLLYRGGFASTVDGNASLLAGATLGGGTTVNWMNCVRLPEAVRTEWATHHGLEDVADRQYDLHEQAVLDRLGATTACSDHNGPHQRMRAGAEALGHRYTVAALNIDPSRYQADKAGYAPCGDATGSRRGAVATYLRDAAEAGAQILVRTRAERVMVADGRAVGVDATFTDQGQTTRVRVSAPAVVVAAGALESPALLARSGIGGPAVGKNLHIHPALSMLGVYDQDLQAWWGPPQAGIMDQFSGADDGYGYLVEGSQYLPGLFAAILAQRPAAAHKGLMGRWARVAPFLAILRDRSAGDVRLDQQGQAEFRYSLSDGRDLALARQSLATLARLHVAAGARELTVAAPGGPTWRAGEDLDAFLEILDRLPIGAGGIRIGSAHQMSTCRMGLDPRTSVANPLGQLHDIEGVWIGDTSAFPTASGANPMLTCMTLARRLARNLSQA
ncbi:MAG TPA: GMC family oxidoreductase [Chloroflexota bacterium]|nr:GMC family oxidoreductase [Chloroflexota bacterium]